MYSILTYLDNYYGELPLKSKLKTPSELTLPGGATIQGVFKENHLDGDFQLTFQEFKTTVNGKIKANQVQNAFISYETGLEIETTFQNNGIQDSFFEAKIYFLSGFVLEAEYNPNGDLYRAILKNPQETTVSVWQNKKIVYHFDEKKNAGIIIERNKVYEGEILNGRRTGFGAQYYPEELKYTVYEAAEDQSVTKIVEVCFLGTEQY